MLLWLLTLLLFVVAEDERPLEEGIARSGFERLRGRRVALLLPFDDEREGGMIEKRCDDVICSF